MAFTPPTGITRIITHANCADGIISAAILHRVFPDAVVEPVQYGTPARENLEITEGMIFVDMSPPLHLVDEAVAKGAYILDHHKGAKETVLKFGERGVFADEKERPGVSGAWLAYEEVHKTMMPDDPSRQNFLNVAQIIGIYDTWQKDSPGWELSRAYSAAVRFFGQNYFLLELIATDYLRFDSGIYAVGERILEQNKEHVQQAMASMIGFKSGVLRFGVYPDPRRVSSEVGEEATRVRNVYDVVAGFNYTGGTGPTVNLNFSLRSNDNFDVSVFAKKFGGSGHTHAAGFTQVVDTFNSPNPYALFKTLVRSS